MEATSVDEDSTKMDEGALPKSESPKSTDDASGKHPPFAAVTPHSTAQAVPSTTMVTRRGSKRKASEKQQEEEQCRLATKKKQKRQSSTTEDTSTAAATTRMSPRSKTQKREAVDEGLQQERERNLPPDNAETRTDEENEEERTGRATPVATTPPSGTCHPTNSATVVTRSCTRRQLNEQQQQQQQQQQKQQRECEAIVNPSTVSPATLPVAAVARAAELQEPPPTPPAQSVPLPNIVTPESAATISPQCHCCFLDSTTRESFPLLAQWMLDNGHRDLLNNHFPHGKVEACSSGTMGQGGVKKRRKQQRSQRRGKGRQKSNGGAGDEQSALCHPCQLHWKTTAAEYCSLRESQLMAPLNQAMFPEPIFKVGGVSTEFMEVFLSLKQKVTENPARLKDFEKLTKTKGAGKFQYFVTNHAASQKRWNWKDAKLLENCPYETEMLEKFVLDFVAEQLPMGRGGYRMDPGFVMTKKTFVQEPHRDYKGYADVFKHTCGKEAGSEKQSSGQRCGCANPNKPETRFFPWIIHLPLCREGMWLNYWPDGNRSKPPLRIFIPFGTFLAARVDGVHGGLFGGPGNVRFHAALTPLRDAIRAKGYAWKREGLALSDAVIRRHCKLGAHESGQDPRELDHLKEDFSDYCCPEEWELGKCRAGHPITFADPGFVDKMLQVNATFTADLFENASLATKK